MVGEELERGTRGPLLALEHHGGERREEQQGGAAGHRPRGEAGLGPVAERPVADLVVVLGEGDEPAPVDVVGNRASPVAAPEGGVAAVVDEHVPQRVGEHLGAAEVHVVAEGLPGQPRVQGVVHVVRPLAVHAETALAEGGHHGDVVEVGLRDEAERAAELLLELRDPGGQLGEDVRGGVVLDGVHGVETEGVHVEVAQPPQGVVDDERTDAAAVGTVQVESRPPRGLVALGEVGPELGEVVAGGAEVVVHHVEGHADALLVGGVHEPLEGRRPSVGVVHGVEADAVVAPAAPPGEGRHGHEFDDVDAQVTQVSQPADRGVEGPLGRERADVQLVGHGTADVDPPPVGVVPLVHPGVEGPGGVVHAVGLPGAPRIGPRLPPVHADEVVGAVLDVDLEVAPAGRRHLPGGLAQHQVGPLRLR